MLGLIAAVVAVAGVAAFAYLRWERLGLEGVGLAALRTVGMGAIVLLLINPARTVRVPAGPPTVLLDASLSMAAGHRWAEALDSARALAAGGAVLRFGTGSEPFDTTPPVDGMTRLLNGLATARGRGGATIVVTDGEVEDVASLPPALLEGVRTVVLPRDTVPDAALLDVHVPARLARDDSIALTVTIGTWGALDAGSAALEVYAGARRLRVEQVALPPAPGTARRRLALPPGTLAAGDHILRVRLVADGDAEPRDDERWRAVLVTETPSAVVVADPADWEGRFLAQELDDLLRGTVRAYARVGAGRWVDMRSLDPVPEAAVRAAVREAELAVVRGSRSWLAARRTPAWHWPAGAAGEGELFTGDWYVTSQLPSSPLAGPLAGVPWDSVPPLVAIVPLAPAGREWVAITAHQGRRGAARPVVVGWDSSGMRRLTTAGAGLWRWRFRGGGPREAYRALLASGVDWLLASDAVPVAQRLAAPAVVTRGVPVQFRWRGDSVPDSLEVRVRGEDAPRVLRFDAAGVASLRLEPGAHRWTSQAVRASGTVLVEPYSPEFHPRPVMILRTAPGGGTILEESFARQRWWLFALAIAAFVSEWAWRQWRGLA